MKVLIVNDEVYAAEIMKENIPWSDYGIEDVYVAFDAMSARSCILENKIDIMLCDIEMSGENGISLLRWVRNEKIELECIFLTCHAKFEYVKEAIELDCQNYLVTPVKDEKIGLELQKVVERIRNKREMEQYAFYGKQAIKDKTQELTDINKEQKNASELMEEVAQYIFEHIGSERLNIDQVAEHFFLHPIYLNRIFKREKGISLGQFIIAERMKLAAEILKTKKMNAITVASTVGYVSYAHFSVTFKKYYGCSPTQYQKENSD